tara:strand:- start:10168 stop:10524 length:357 start_codon:yes stop_codon:yes gene_type:complete
MTSRSIALNGVGYNSRAIASMGYWTVIVVDGTPTFVRISIDLESDTLTLASDQVEAIAMAMELPDTDRKKLPVDGELVVINAKATLVENSRIRLKFEDSHLIKAHLDDRTKLRLKVLK